MFLIDRLLSDNILGIVYVGLIFIIFGLMFIVL